MIRRSEALRVILYVRGSPPADIPLATVPAAFDAQPQPAPDLSQRALSTSGLRTVVEMIVPPAYARRSPGTYALRVPGSAETFGVFSIGG
jgi:hypothetical protein